MGGVCFDSTTAACEGAQALALFGFCGMGSKECCLNGQLVSTGTTTPEAEVEVEVGVASTTPSSETSETPASGGPRSDQANAPSPLLPSPPPKCGVNSFAPGGGPAGARTGCSWK